MARSVQGTIVVSTSPRCLCIRLDWSLVAASREGLSGRQDLPELQPGRQELESFKESKSATSPRDVRVVQVA